MNLLKRYWFFALMIAVMLVIAVLNRDLGIKAAGITTFTLKEMALVIPPIFILLGLLDLWVPREIMIKYMGEGSGIKGVILAFILGSAAAGPLYGAFPVAGMLMPKGSKFSNVLIFIGALRLKYRCFYLKEPNSLISFLSPSLLDWRYIVTL